MKIAGMRNPGAWSRMNRYIKSLPDSAKSDLVNVIAAIDTFDSFLTAMNSLRTSTGSVNLPALTAGALASVYGHKGIPLCVWMGQLAFDVLTDDGTKRAHTTQVRRFASDLRQAVKLFRFARRQVNDVENMLPANQDNPGGVADDTEGT